MEETNKRAQPITETAPPDSEVTGDLPAEAETAAEEAPAEKPKDKETTLQKVSRIVGIVLCVLLVPVLIINITLILKGYFNKDDVPTFAGVFPMIVYTDSMSGVFESGDLIICKSVDPEEVKEQDVITFFDPASANSTSIVTHRVQKVNVDAEGNITFTTRGDANTGEDRLPVPAEKLVGVYSGIRLPNMGHVALFMQTTPGLVVCVLIPLMALVLYDIIRRKLSDKKHDDDREALLRELEALRSMQQTATVPAEPVKAEPAEEKPTEPAPVEEAPKTEAAPAPEPKRAAPAVTFRVVSGGDTKK